VALSAGTRIPSSSDSGFPATGYDGQRPLHNEPPRRRSAAATVARRCDRLPGWSHLGCDHAGPSLHGPWMGCVHGKPRHPADLALAGLRRLLLGRLPGGHRLRCRCASAPPPLRGGHGRPEVRPFARLVAPWLRPRRAKPARAMDGRAGAEVSSRRRDRDPGSSECGPRPAAAPRIPAAAAGGHAAPPPAAGPA